MLRKNKQNQAAGQPQDTGAEGEDLELVIEGELSAAANEIVQELQARLDEAESGRKRAMADFVNFQRRARENEITARREGITSTVRSLLPALDNFDLALGQDIEQTSTDQLLQGIRMVREQLMAGIESLGIRRIAPEPGDEFNPNLHQAVVQQPSEEHPAGSVLATLQVGFTMNDMVLRPATVIVASAPAGAAPFASAPGADEDSEADEPVVHDITDADAGLEELYYDDKQDDEQDDARGDTRRTEG